MSKGSFGDTCRLALNQTADSFWKGTRHKDDQAAVPRVTRVKVLSQTEEEMMKTKSGTRHDMISPPADKMCQFLPTLKQKIGFGVLWVRQRHHSNLYLPQSVQSFNKIYSLSSSHTEISIYEYLKVLLSIILSIGD